jgi:hypothetical protein
MKNWLRFGIGIVLFGLTLPKAADRRSEFDGYWELQKTGDAYERFIRIQDGKGFNCVLDGKSSFPFEIIGDSMTTPLNGRDKLTWMPSSGDLVIQGEEKGTPYLNRFSVSDSSKYWSKCKAEEANAEVTGTRNVFVRRVARTDKLLPHQVLGRTGLPPHAKRPR